MPKSPNVVVKDRQTGRVYKVSEARFRRSPELWERLGTDPKKPRRSIDEAAARKAGTDTPVPDPDLVPVDDTESTTQDDRPDPGGEEGHTSGHPAASQEGDS